MKQTANRGGQKYNYKLNLQEIPTYYLLFILFVTTYATSIVLFANFSVIDDHTLTQTLLINKKIPWFIFSDGGRFYPLDGIDLNILSMIFKPSAYIFYLFSAIFAIIVAICVYKTSKLYGEVYKNNMLHAYNYSNLDKLACICVIAILLSPTFITSFLRLFVPEKLESVFFGIFMLSYAYFYIRNKNSILNYAIVLSSANIALYFKETAFILLGCMAFFHLVFTFKNKNQQKILDCLLIISSLIWLIVYFVVIILNKTTDTMYGDTPYNQYIVLLKNTISYILSEPFLFIGIPALIIFRAYLILINKNKINPFLDSALIASFMHLLSYLILNIYSLHYPLPAYIFAIYPIVYYFREYIKNIFIKSVFIICMFIYVFNSFPTFIYYFNHYKAIPTNFQNTLTFLDNYLKNNEQANIYLHHVNSALNIEVYHSFIRYLEFMGNNNFDLLTDLAVDDVWLYTKDNNAKYSVFKHNNLIEPKKGDLIVITPYSNAEINENKLSNYSILYETKFGFNIPLLNIKSIFKYIAYIIFPDTIKSTNIWQNSVNFKIYRVK